MNALSTEDIDHILAHTGAIWEELRGGRIFITGGTGFFGCWLLESFLWANEKLNLDASAVVLSRNPGVFVQKAPHLAQNPAVTLHEGDIRSFDFPNGTFSHVIHAATEASAKLNEESPLLMLDTIVEGTRRALDFAVQCGARKFLLTSSGAVYGKQPPGLTRVSEDYTGAPDPMDPRSAYGNGKRLAEHLCALYSKQHGLETKIARCFAFVGPYLPLDIHFAIGNFIRDAMKGAPIRINGDGTPCRSYLYAADLTIWLWTILFRGESLRPYNVGSEESLTIEQIARLVSASVNPPCPVEIARKPIAGKPAERYVPSTRRAEAELGLKCQIPLEEAIRRTEMWQSKIRQNQPVMSPAPKMKIRLSDYIFQTLVSRGIDQVFLVTGGGAMHLNDAIGRCQGLKAVCCHHEQACAIAAEGYARVTGKPAIVNPTTGPGCLNALTGVFGAWTDSVPMVVISGQVKRETCMGFYEGTRLRQLGDQEIDIVSIAKPITKSAILLREPERVRYELERALYLATTGRPGPCWIDVPLDIQAALIDPETLEGFVPDDTAAPEATQKLDQQIDAVIERLLHAKRPVILGGNGLRAGNATQEFQELLAQAPIPVVESRTACDLLPSDHPLLMGRSGLDADRAGNFVLQSSDFLLVLGSRLGIRQMGYNRDLYAREAFIVHVDIDEAELHKATLEEKTDLKVAVDLKLFLARFNEKLAARKNQLPDWSEWAQWGKSIYCRYYGAQPHHREHQDAINPYGFLEKLFQQLRQDDIIVCGNGAAFIMTSHVARISGSQKMFFNSGCASMGYDLPAGIGAAVAGAGRRVICFAGDGSLQMNIQELQTVQHHQLNIILVVINNGGYLSIRTTQEGFFGFCFGESAETGVSFPNIAAVASAYSLPSIRISETDFEEKLKTALSHNGPLVLEVMVDPQQKFEPRIASKQLPSGKIVSPPLEDMFPYLSEEELKSCLQIPLAYFE